MAQERYLIGPGLKDKLGEVIRRVDGGATPGFSVTPSSVRFEEPFRGRGDFFRIGTYGTAAWALNASATVTLTNVSPTGSTVLVTNVFGALSTATASRNVGIAKDGTQWYLIQAQCP
jgi:hypothetical protein